MSAIVIAGDTSGTCTLQANAVAGTTVLTLPTSSGTLVSTTTPLNASSITSGTLAVAYGGTGANSSAAAPFALKGANSDITSLSGLTTALSVAQGGTGTSTPSLVAGTNVSISGTWPNQTINSTSPTSGTVTSVATGNGLQGGTITTSGTLSLACPSFNTVGSYTLGQWFYDSGGSGSLSIAAGGTVAAGGGSNQLQATNLSASQSGNDPQNVLSGTWRNMGVRLTIYQVSNPNFFGASVSSLFCRVS